MKRYAFAIIASAALFLTGCLQNGEPATQSSSSGSAQLNLQSSSNASGCTVAQEASGSRIQCGGVSGLVANGATGPAGPQGPQGIPGPLGGPPMPYLINGDGVNLGRVLSYETAEIRAPSMVTIWVPEADSLLTYRFGKLDGENPLLAWYESTDCTGQLYVNYDDLGFTNVIPSKDFIVYFENHFYKMTGIYSSSLSIRSLKAAGQSCETLSGVQPGKYQKADLLTSNLPAVLTEGWAVKFQ